MAFPLSAIEQAVQPFRKFWNERIQKQSNQFFKIFQFTPIPIVYLNDLDLAKVALSNDVSDTIEAQSRDWHGVKVWPVLFVRYESANFFEEQFKTFDAYLPVSHSIFIYNQPELYADQNNPYIDGLKRMAERLFEANAKFIRGTSGLVLVEIYSLNLNAARFAPLSGLAWTPLPKFLQNKRAIVNVQNKYDRCFGSAIASALDPVEKHSDRPNMYSRCFEMEGLDGIEYFVNPIDIRNFKERLNISINFLATLMKSKELATQCISVDTKVFAKLICFTLTNITRGSKILAVYLQI